MLKQNVLKWVQGVNPTINYSSSLGGYVTPISEQISDRLKVELLSVVFGNGSLAELLLKNQQDSYTQKQIFVIAYEIMKYPAYVQKIEDYYKSLIKPKKSKSKSKSKAFLPNRFNNQ